MSTVSCPEYGDIQDKLHRLETDREGLCLQVNVIYFVVPLVLFLGKYFVTTDLKKRLLMTNVTVIDFLMLNK